VDFIVIGAGWIGGSADTLLHIVKIAMGIGFVIFVHEMGHFLAAKMCGVKCEKFYIGFDVPIKIGPIQLPSKLCHFKYGETEYGVGIIPLGGYVKMLGQEDHPGNQAEEAERIRVETEGEDGEIRVELDPRSYAAKSVPQRMMIISAGVIMNVFFAMLMAAAAYKMGVSYSPCLVSGTLAAHPAWVAGIQPGDLLTKIGNDREESEQLRFKYDLATQVMKAGFGKESPDPIDLTVKRNGQSIKLKVAPNRRGDDPRGMASIGVLSVHSTTLAMDPKDFPFRATSKATPSFATGDRIVAFNGSPLDDSLANKAGDLPLMELRALLVQHVDKPIDVTVSRTNNDGKLEKVNITVPPQPRKWLGIVMTMGAIVAIQNGSPADAAGLRAGDVMLTAQGEPVGDPVTLAFRLRNAKEVQLTLRRKGVADPLDVTLIATENQQPSNPYDNLLRLDRLGIAYAVDPIVSHVALSNEEEKLDVQIGDEVVSFDLEPRNQTSVKGTDKTPHQWATERLGKSYGKMQELDENFSWVKVDGWVQQVPPEIQFRLKLKRGDKETVVQLLPVEQPNHFLSSRGFVFAEFTRVRTADSVAAAMSLGVRETKERLSEVWTIFTHLIRGNISTKNLGGPILIAKVASDETKKGIPSLLIFLTMLSANLAILNALPFPVLDGGHFTFLLWEGIVRRPVPERLQVGLSMFGLVGLLLLMAYVFFNDISRLLSS